MAAEFKPDADVELMLRVKGGDREAFVALVERWKQPVMNLVARTLPDDAEAEDVAQAVFIQVHRAAGRYEPTARFSTWLFTIARNLCLNEIRRRSRHPTESLDQREAADEDGPGRGHAAPLTEQPTERLLQAELVAKVEEAVRDLPESQRTAILLLRDQDMAYEEIAQVLGTSVSATKSLIHRGRETLRERLKAYLQTGAWHSARPPAQLSPEPGF